MPYKTVIYCRILIVLFPFLLLQAGSARSVFIYDDPNEISEDFTGRTDFDSTDNRNLTISWNAEQESAMDWHIYVRKGLGGAKYLGHTGNGSDSRLDWYAGASNLASEFANGPDFNSAYLFRVVRIDGDLGPDDYFDMDAPVGFNLEGGNSVILSRPDNPNLNPGQVVIYDDILGGNNLAPMDSFGSDQDKEDSRAIQIAWNFGIDPSTVNEYHVFVSIDSEPLQFLGQTFDGTINYFWWTDQNWFRTSPDFTEGPKDGHMYQFQVYLSPLVGYKMSMTSGTLIYSVSSDSISSKTMTPTPIDTIQKTPTFQLTSTAFHAPTHTFFPLTPTPTATLPYTSTSTRSPLITPTETVLPEIISITLPGLSTNAKTMQMVLIRPGSFIMGSPGNEQDRQSNEGPQHQVTITRDFYIGKYEVTQAQWETVMGSNPSTFSGNPDYPVDTVTWFDCLEFIQNLNAANLGQFRLPTEAEWEYACRAGTTTRFYWGDDPQYQEIKNYAWNWFNSGQTIQPAGLLEPNDWKLHDMSGNGQEWCSDLYGLYTTESVIDPIGARQKEKNVFCG